MHDLRRWRSRYAYILLAEMLWLAPSMTSLAQRHWSTSQGAQGPIIMFVALWAAFHTYRRQGLVARPGSLGLSVGLIAACVLMLTFARMAGILSLEMLAAFAGSVVVLYAFAGWAVVRRVAMPLAFLLCAVPLPYFLEQALTGTLKVQVASWSIELLANAGFEVANSGSMLYIDQYQLLVDAACSGLNSVFSLVAIGIFYIFWERRDHFGQALILAALLVPIAVVANLFRVITILLLVHRYGDTVLETALHPAAGLVMFVVALAALVALDIGLRRLSGGNLA